MARLFEYIDYDKISDDLYFLGGGERFILRMNVSLAKKNKDDNSRRHFYNEYSYDSKYSDKGQVVSIRRSYDYYITLESLENRLSGVMIRPQDMILLRSRLAEVLTWFSSDVFVIRKGKIMVNKLPNPIIIDGFPEKKSISFEPVVIDWEDSNQSMGVRITLSGAIYSDISIDKFYGFVYIMNSINMVQSAQSMLAFFGMPEYGTNRYEVDWQYNDMNQAIPKEVIKERKFKPKGGTSYFDRVDV